MEHDPRFESHQKRTQNQKALILLLEEIFATKTAAEWGRLFDENGVLWDPMQLPSEVASDPQVQANQYMVDMDHPTKGKFKMVTSPVQFDNEPVKAGAPAPALGQHTEEVLLGMGYSWEDLRKLKEEQVIS